MYIIKNNLLFTKKGLLFYYLKHFYIIPHICLIIYIYINQD